MNTTENLISTGCPAVAQQPINNIIKPIKFPAQPQEWKIVSLRECPTPDTMQQCETPDRLATNEQRVAEFEKEFQKLSVPPSPAPKDVPASVPEPQNAPEP